jgi:pimeloyl-ACP methyl ester carboxylesterase
MNAILVGCDVGLLPTLRQLLAARSLDVGAVVPSLDAARTQAFPALDEERLFVVQLPAGPDVSRLREFCSAVPGRPVLALLDAGNDLSRLVAAMRAGAAQVVSTGTVPSRDSLPEELRPIFSADPNYLRGLFSFDPVAEAAKVKVPTLIVRGGNDGSILPGDVDALKNALPNGDTLVSPLGSNTLSLPQGQEGRFHNPARHGTTRDGDALAAIDDWIKGNVKG